MVSISQGHLNITINGKTTTLDPQGRSSLRCCCRASGPHAVRRGLEGSSRRDRTRSSRGMPYHKQAPPALYRLESLQFHLPLRAASTMVGISSIKDLDYYSESASGSEKGHFILQNAVPGTLDRANTNHLLSQIQPMKKFFITVALICSGTMAYAQLVDVESVQQIRLSENVLIFKIGNLDLDFFSRQVLTDKEKIPTFVKIWKKWQRNSPSNWRGWGQYSIKQQ